MKPKRKVSEITKELLSKNSKTADNNKTQKSVDIADIKPEKKVIKTTNPKTIRDALTLKNSCDEDKTVLTFNSETNELELSPKGSADNKSVVVDQIYKDGFFCDIKKVA